MRPTNYTKQDPPPREGLFLQFEEAGKGGPPVKNIAQFIDVAFITS